MFTNFWDMLHSGSLRLNAMLIISAIITYRCFIYIIHGCPRFEVSFLKLSVKSSQVIQHWSPVTQHSSLHGRHRTKSPWATCLGLYGRNGWPQKRQSLLSLPFPIKASEGWVKKERERDRKGLEMAWSINRGGMSETTGRRTRVMTISPWHWSLWQPEQQPHIKF